MAIGWGARAMLHGPPALKALGAALLALLGAAASLPALDGSKPEKPLPPTPLPSTRVHEESKIGASAGSTRAMAASGAPRRA